MRKSTMLVCGGVLLLGSAAAFAQSGYRDPGRWGQRGDIVRCDSNDRRMVRCLADTRGGVRLARKISDAACNEGSSWGYGRDHVWVSAGCRAEFQVGRGGGNRPGPGPGNGAGPGWGNGGGRIVRCDSNDRKMHRCPADTRGGVRLAKKISDASCTEGRTWGYGQDHVWVSAGCRAEFEIGRGWNRPRR